MEHIYFRFIFWYLLLQRHNEHMVESSKSFDDMPRLKEFCPYSSFCGHNASSDFPHTENYRPCCQSCSCNPDCGLQGDCCFSQKEEYSIGEDLMICRHTFAADHLTEYKGIFGHIARATPHYRMIDKCYNIKGPWYIAENTCEQNVSDIEDFHPMFSPYTGLIYINAFCVMCNNITDAIPWKRAVVCPKDAETSLSDVMDTLSNEHISTDYHGCFLYYIPPFNVSLDSELCYPNVIRKCNATGKMAERNHYWEYCEMFNATFLLKIARFTQAYANVYCFICNGVYNDDIFDKMRCKSSIPFDEKNPFPSVAPLTIVIESQSGPRSTSRTEEEKGQCPMNSVMVNSFMNSCRRLKCPMGQFLINNKCDYFSKKWIGGPFAVLLRLSLIRKDVLLPASFFKNMQSKDRYDSRSRWIRRKTLRRWKFLVMYHPSEDQATVEYIVVKASHPSKTVDPHVLKGSILRALRDKWEVIYINDTISFSINLNEYSEYFSIHTTSLWSIGVNLTNDLAYLPNRPFCGHFDKMDTEKYTFLLFPIWDFRISELNRGMLITKLFFCDQVELLPDEYEYTACLNIFFKMKNVTLETFSRVQLPVSNILGQNASSVSRKLTSRLSVCVQEFDIASNVVTRTSIYFSGLFFIICTGTFLSQI